jgi:hypothetical protein
MITKLTLTLEQEVVKPAKIYARKKGRSLSELIENYLKAIISKKTNSDDLSLRVKRLIGSVNLKEDFDYKKTLEEQIVKRYSK